LSPRNPRVVAARRLLRRSARSTQRAFLVEGPQPVREALARPGDGGWQVREVFVLPAAAQRHPDVLAAAEAAGVPVHVVGTEALASLSGTVSPQGLVAVCPFLDVPLADVLAQPPDLAVLLAEVQDPGNAGTVVRVADAAGAGAVVLGAGSVDPYNPKCVRATAGSLFHLPLVTGVGAAGAVTDLRAAGLQVLAADAAGELDLDHVEVDTLAAPTTWLFGNEARGLPAELRDLADATVRVPIHGRAESLNLATAAAVCLYASARAQRHATSRR
jgi:RNA methyltransferase, TrmH family